MHRVTVHVVSTADPARRANTQDVLRDEVADYPVEAKMTAMTNAGTFVMMIAIGVCWICGEDPLGECVAPAHTTGSWASLIGSFPKTPLMGCTDQLRDLVCAPNLRTS